MPEGGPGQSWWSVQPWFVQFWSRVYQWLAACDVLLRGCDLGPGRSEVRVPSYIHGSNHTTVLCFWRWNFWQKNQHTGIQWLPGAVKPRSPARRHYKSSIWAVSLQQKNCRCTKLNICCNYCLDQHFVSIFFRAGIHYRKSCASSGACLIASSGYQQFCTGRLNSVCIYCCNTPLCNGPRRRRPIPSAVATSSSQLTMQLLLLVAFYVMPCLLM